MDLVHNERTKLTATAINNLAVAFAVAGFVAPLVAVSFGAGSAPIIGAAAIVTSLIWLVAALALHWLARAVLKRLRS